MPLYEVSPETIEAIPGAIGKILSGHYIGKAADALVVDPFTAGFHKRAEKKEMDQINSATAEARTKRDATLRTSGKYEQDAKGSWVPKGSIARAQAAPAPLTPAQQVAEKAKAAGINVDSPSSGAGNPVVPQVVAPAAAQTSATAGPWGATDPNDPMSRQNGAFVKETDGNQVGYKAVGQQPPAAPPPVNTFQATFNNGLEQAKSAYMQMIGPAGANAMGAGAQAGIYGNANQNMNFANMGYGGAGAIGATATAALEANKQANDIRMQTQGPNGSYDYDAVANAGLREGALKDQLKILAGLKQSADEMTGRQYGADVGYRSAIESARIGHAADTAKNDMQQQKIDAAELKNNRAGILNYWQNMPRAEEAIAQPDRLDTWKKQSKMAIAQFMGNTAKVVADQDKFFWYEINPKTGKFTSVAEIPREFVRDYGLSGTDKLVKKEDFLDQIEGVSATKTASQSPAELARTSAIAKLNKKYGADRTPEQQKSYQEELAKIK